MVYLDVFGNGFLRGNHEVTYATEEEFGRIKKGSPYGPPFLLPKLVLLPYILWHLMQSSVLKASLPLWQAPQDFPPLSMSLIFAWSTPALKGKVLVWQSAHLYMPRWNSWLKVASPASVLKRMLPGL